MSWRMYFRQTSEFLTADRLGDDPINFASHARLDHAIELVAAIGVQLAMPKHRIKDRQKTENKKSKMPNKNSP